MLTIQKRIVVSASPEKVFGLVDAAEHLPEFFPNLVEVKDVRPLPLGGHRFHYLYKMGGRCFEGEIETVEQVRNRKLVDRASGELDATFRWAFTPHDGVTQVELGIDYEPPEAPAGELAEPVVRKLNEHEAEVVLENLKTIAEA